MYLACSSCAILKFVGVVAIGASLSKRHTDVLNVTRVCMRTSYRKYTLLQITDPEFAKDYMRHDVQVSTVMEGSCTPSTSRTTMTDPNQSATIFIHYMW